MASKRRKSILDFFDDIFDVNFEEFPVPNVVSTFPYQTAIQKGYSSEDTKDRFIIKVDVPGHNHTSVSVEILRQRFLLVKTEKDKSWAYRCKILLPEHVQTTSASATIKDGLLTVSFKKTNEDDKENVRVDVKEG